MLRNVNNREESFISSLESSTDCCASKLPMIRGDEDFRPPLC